MKPHTFFGPFHRLLPAACGALISIPLAFALPTATLGVAQVTPAELDHICENWIDYLRTFSAPGKAVPTVRPGAGWDLTRGDTLLARSYSIDPCGHVLVSAWPSLPPILMASGEFDLRPDTHPEIVASLAAYLAGVLRGASGGARNSAWDLFALPKSGFSDALARGEVSREAGAGPLLTSIWHQRWPYNNLCPMGDNGRTLVGCAPLAAAQILRFHGWPRSGVGSHSYTWDGDQSCGHNNVIGGTVSASFADPYNWPGMPDACSDCSQAEQDALAELCYEVGVASEADYGNCGTSALVSTLEEGLIAHFRYDSSMVIESRFYYTWQTWFDLLRQEITCGRPVFYLIVGHALVCDGWRIEGGQNQIHVNWGDGGAPYTGWWTVGQLPVSPEPELEACLRGIRPRYKVDPTGGGDFANIQEALDRVPAESIVELADGRFTGLGNRDLDPHGKSVTLVAAGADPPDCVLDCEGTPNSPHRAFVFGSGEGSGMRLEGFTITNGCATDGGAILSLGGASPTLKRMVFHANRASGSGGAIRVEQAAVSVEGCVLSFNEAASGGAVSAVTSEVTILGSTFWSNGGAPAAAAVHAGSGSSISLSGVIVSRSTAGGAVRCEGDGTVILACSDLFENQDGDWIGCIAGQQYAPGNFSSDPLFCDPEGLDFHLDLRSPCRASANPSCGQIGALPVGCVFGNTITLRPDGTGDFPTIQSAVDAAPDGTVIILANGTYQGQGNEEISIRGRSLILRSEDLDPTQCIIDCQGHGGHLVRGFSFEQGAGGAIQGITVRNAYLDWPRTGDGAGILCVDSSPVIDRCRFEGNSAGTTPSFSRGGGLACVNSSPVVTQCFFANNHARSGGAVQVQGGAPTVADCTFEDNVAESFGGAVAVLESAALRVENCAFHRNRALGSGLGGAVHSAASAAVFDGCSFQANSALNRGGAVYTETSAGALHRCTFAGNNALRGGGVCSADSTTLASCTFYGNISYYSSGLALLAGASARLERCLIVSGSYGRAVACDPGTSCLLQCCDLFGNAGGDWVGCIQDQFGVNGNIALDPLLCDPAGGDFHLRDGSPCGPFFPENPSCDLVGAWPVGCGTVAVGGAAFGAPDLELSRPRPNPFSARTEISFNVPRRRVADEGSALLRIYDLGGRLVRTLLPEPPSCTRCRVSWDARDDRGRILPAGVYLLRLAHEGKERHERVLFVR